MSASTPSPPQGSGAQPQSVRIPQTAGSRPKRRVAVSGSVRLRAALAAGGSLLAALYLGISAQQASLVSDADELVAAGEPREALAKAHQASRFPAAADAQLVQAYALDQLGNYDGAAQAFERAAQREPENWIIHRDWAVALAAAGDEEGARREITRAVELNPRMEVPALYLR